MQLSEDQKLAANTIITWYFSKNRTPYITLGGYAGTGKTTLISIIKAYINEKSKDKLKVAFCSYTGRAAQNLKNRLTQNKSLNSRDTISTIHGLIYDPIEDAGGVIIGWAKKEGLDKDLIIVDEASMLDEQIWRDLLFYSIPIIAVGDHGQLPPIQGTFNLMQKPHLKLAQIHRQAKDNPIIEVSIHARETGEIPSKQFGKDIIKYSTQDSDFHSTSTDLLENYSPDTLILCGYYLVLLY